MTETRSTPGRVTWEGTCGHDGCQLPIHARRVPKDTPAPPADTAPADPTDRYRVIEVTSYDQPKHPRPAAAPDPAPAPAGDDGSAAAAGVDDGAAPGVHRGAAPAPAAAAEPGFRPDPRADPGPRELFPDIY